MPPVDLSTFTQEQREAFNSANALGSGVPTINGDQLTSEATPIEIPENPQPTAADFAGVTSGLNFQSILDSLTAKTQEEQTNADIVSRLLEGAGLEQERKQTQLEAEQDPEFIAKQNRVRQLTERGLALQEEALAIPIQVQQEFAGRGVTRGGIEPIQIGRLRENAIQSLSVSALARAARGDLEMAQDNIDRAIELEFLPREREQAILERAYLLNKDALERIDKQKAERAEILLNERARVLELQKEEAVQKNELAVLASSFGIDASKALKAGSYSEALNMIIPQLAEISGREREVQNLITQAELEGKRLANRNAKLTAQKIAAEIIATRDKAGLADDEETAEVEKALAVFTQAQKVLGMGGLDAAVGFGFKKSLLARTASGAVAGAAGGAVAGLPFGGIGAIPAAVGGAILGGTAGAFAGPEAIAGSSRADFEAEATRLANLLTIDNLKLMSGVLSETDIKILESAGSVLGDFDVSEKKYREEINRVMDVARRNYTRLGLTEEQAQFYFGVSDEDIKEVDAMFGDDTTLTPGQFDPLKYYGVTL